MQSYSKAKNMNYKNISLSFKLTLIRLIGSPLILPFFLVYLLPFNNVVINDFLAFFFLCFGATDFLDGYIARKYGQVTKLGASLDHIADKFLLYSTLIALIVVHKIYFFWAIIWIGREFFILGLRIIALENNVSVEVSSYGKSKTVAQITCLAFIILNPYQNVGMSAAWWNGIELFLIVIATGLSVFSAYKYCCVLMEKAQ
jgi:CDP-diacylglycerol--glycerol-3-phosphate 3-phosphatidyltransferase